MFAYPCIPSAQHVASMLSVLKEYMLKTLKIECVRCITLDKSGGHAMESHRIIIFPEDHVSRKVGEES